MSVFAHVPIFLFNTCVTLGAAQLKSNTLQESITCWVYWQLTELKWPTEKGQAVSFEEHGNNIMENMITETELPANAAGVTDIQKIDTDGNSLEGNQAVLYQKQWNMDGMMGWH